jgi:hypothetical protein
MATLQPSLSLLAVLCPLSMHMDVHRLRICFGSVSAVLVTCLTCTHSLVCFLLTHPLLYHMLRLCDSQPSTDSCIASLSVTPTCVVYSLALQASTNLETLCALSGVIAQPPAIHTFKSTANTMVSALLHLFNEVLSEMAKHIPSADKQRLRAVSLTFLQAAIQDCYK